MQSYMFGRQRPSQKESSFQAFVNACVHLAGKREGNFNPSIAELRDHYNNDRSVQSVVDKYCPLKKKWNANHHSRKRQFRDYEMGRVF